MKNTYIKCSFSDLESEAARLYMRDIMRLPQLSAEEEQELAKTIAEETDNRSRAAARERLVTGNLRFVVSTAKQYRGQTLTLLDLVQEGNIGMIRAAGSYTGQNGARFVTYARPFVHEAIRMALSEKDQMMSRTCRAMRHESLVRREQEHFLHRFERQPTALELSELTGLDERDVVSILYRTTTTRSTDQSDVEALHIADHVDPDAGKNVDLEQLRQTLHRSLRLLTPSERELMHLIYGLDGKGALTLQEAALRLDTAYSHVRKLHSTALRKLRQVAGLEVFR